ncbi:MAG: DUF4870 domain-containing protein [Nocardioidaceae bacterium]
MTYDQPTGTTYSPTGEVPYAYAPAVPAEDRNVGMLAHLVPIGAMILSAGFLGFVGSLVIYLLYKDRGPFARQYAANSLNIQLTMLVVLVVSVPLMLVLVGFLSFGLAFLVAFVLHLVGVAKASSGQWWNPPVTIRFVG